MTMSKTYGTILSSLLRSFGAMMIMWCVGEGGCVSFQGVRMLRAGYCSSSEQFSGDEWRCKVERKWVERSPKKNSVLLVIIFKLLSNLFRLKGSEE